MRLPLQLLQLPLRQLLPPVATLLQRRRRRRRKSLKATWYVHFASIIICGISLYY
jgi:hypothetical protein